MDARRPRMASKPVKLQRPDSGHRVQSLLKMMFRTWPPASCHSHDKKKQSATKSVKVCMPMALIAEVAKSDTYQSSNHRSPLDCSWRFFSSAHPIARDDFGVTTCLASGAGDPGRVHCLDSYARRSLSRAASILPERMRASAFFRPAQILLPVYL